MCNCIPRSKGLTYEGSTVQIVLLPYKQQAYCAQVQSRTQITLYSTCMLCGTSVHAQRRPISITGWRINAGNSAAVAGREQARFCWPDPTFTTQFCSTKEFCSNHSNQNRLWLYIAPHLCSIDSCCCIVACVLLQGCYAICCTHCVIASPVAVSSHHWLQQDVTRTTPL